MSELVVGSIAGLAANSYVVDVASGSTLDLSAGAVLPSGSVLQVVSTTYNVATTVTTSANYYDLADLNTDLTCSSTSSKVLITAHVCGDFAGDITAFALTANGSVITGAVAASASNRVAASGVTPAPATQSPATATVTFLHSPNSTSAVTYGIRLLEVTSGSQSDTWYINRSSSDSDNDDRAWGTSAITLMEVAG